MIEEITIMGGFDKQENPEPVKKVVIKRGEIFGVVGPTGSGKSSLIGDIEQLSQEDSFSRRKILVNGEEPSYEDRTNPRKKMVAQLSQNMNFLADMTVGEFLSLHAKCRGASSKCVNAVIELANTLTGEPIKKDHDLTILSGGQSRALMVADVAIISNSPIVLIDEIENAGIRKHDALEALAGHGKIVMVVTHDPVLALMTDKRIVMKNGGMQNVVSTSEEEKTISQKLNKIDELMLSLRDKVRNGEIIQDISMEDLES
ncbi:MAG: ATP-binding cassette domain-containing protein [Methanobacterium formicicum]|jgi:ABC-type lipoprotein export system ATPase subunit|uniref:ABC transporter ATP-binding protein n=1 Tax=Methanobacterium formicicum TaxID=2162 RepID=A0A090I8S8_METFO|nr:MULTISPECIES: ATP-binding cassette domain-containing protein [Methanobacterium]AIS32616.1 ABC transporter ATP-binding protein [Methanobacterium formicicum]MDD4809877.1 ATP-binding cassette domain-containing protein [Methanobacterium formicicum]MDG3546474.1 ATP-binding cassette domain-containing protein [Methanobacterium formicicum]MDH2658407.1 ATP-binding cassette domain-containing protein [Methanobacterium formicicum]CEA14928.1 putative ABC transporter ATP-binding protein MJ0121 [Methanoba